MATVTLTNIKQGTIDHRTTDDNGDFTFPSVQVGEYTVTAEKSGFSASKSDVFALQVAARQRVDLSLKVGQASETVTVSGAATMLETDTSDRGEVIDHREAVDLPLNGRVVTDLAILVPGVRLNAQLDTAFRAAVKLPTTSTASAPPRITFSSTVWTTTSTRPRTRASPAR